tara:strand:- start:7073 stop:8050 length:978 start_codon:yes stop_codon:yes gene_type:complete
MELSEALETNRTKLDLEFSKDISRAYGDVKIMIPINYAEEAYDEIKEDITDYSPTFFQAFLKRGLSNLAQLKAKKTETFLITAHAVNALRDMFNQYQRITPPWLPETFQVNEQSGHHQRSFYFDWSTVNPCHIPHNMENYIIMKLNGELGESKPAQKPVAINIAKNNIHAISKPLDAPTSTLLETDICFCPDAEHGRFVAKKYLWLINSATKRNLDFSITIEELSSLLKNKTCYYTDAELISYPHEKGDNADHLPDNYLTIDRRDNDRGYVQGNVVVCSKEINKLKNQMSESDFKRAVAFKTILSQSNLNSEQIHAVTAMMKGHA